MYEEEMCVKMFIYKNYTKMHGQQNIKSCNFHLLYLQVKSQQILLSVCLCNLRIFVRFQGTVFELIIMCLCIFT